MTLTIKDLKKALVDQRKEINKDIETAVAQVVDAVIKHTASKEDLKEVKEELGGKIDELSVRINRVENEVKDVKRTINDLKADLPTPQEFANHEKRITNLETSAFPA